MSEPHAIPESESDKKQGDKLEHVLEPKGASPIQDSAGRDKKAMPEAESLK